MCPAPYIVERKQPKPYREFRVYSSLTRQTDQDSPISRSLASNACCGPLHAVPPSHKCCRPQHPLNAHRPRHASEHQAYGRRRCSSLRGARSDEDQQPTGGLQHAGAHSTMTTAHPSAPLRPRAAALPKALLLRPGTPDRTASASASPSPALTLILTLTNPHPHPHSNPRPN